MILRRLSQSLKAQDWLAIIIEFVLLVVGVFLGIQVANWNADRETNQKAEIFSMHLKADLRQEAFGCQCLIEYNRDVLASAEKAVNALNGKAPTSNEVLLINAYRATNYKQPQRYRATYDELISTGNIVLIKDENLRSVAMRIYNVESMDNMVREGAQSRLREAFRMNIDNDVQAALEKQCGDHFVKRGDYKAILDVIDYPCTLDFPQKDIDQAAETLRNNPLIASYLRVRIADIKTRLNDMTGNSRDILQGLNEFAQN